jgi:hypothetical protein
MSAPTSLTVTLTDSTQVVISIPNALQGLDSGQQGQQTGFSAADQLVRAIFRAGVFTDSQGNWWPVSQITKLAAQ